MKTLSIGEIARLAGFETSALRYYEEIGLLPRPAREAGRRRYNPDVLERLAVIALAKEAGFRLDEIKTLLDGFAPDTPVSTRWRTLAQHKIPEIDAHIGRLRAMKRLLQQGIECDCVEISSCSLALAGTI
ncbi:MAG: MerR family transcriptional regulator [Myxococcota bacterium]